MRPSSRRWTLALALSAAAAVLLAADAFAPKGAKATLTVDFLYESSGKTGNKDDSRQWQVKNTASLTVDLAAQAPSALPQMQALDSAQTAELAKKKESSAAAQKKMEPMMASAQEILAKCGENEACIERETKKLGDSMAGTKELETAKSAGKDMDAVAKTGPPRYQVWRATASKGTYTIDETLKHAYAEPTYRATEDTTWKGSGDVPVLPGAGKVAGSGYASLEFDAQKNTFAFMLPAPGPLPYTQEIKTDDPSPNRPRGKSQKQYGFPVTAEGKSSQDKPFVVALKGGWKSQSGEQVVDVKGDGAQGGKLTIRWRFSAP